MKQGKTTFPAQEKTLKQRATERAARAASPLPEVKTFRVTAQATDVQPTVKQSITLQDQLNKERLREVQFKNHFRSYLSVFFAILLAAQNIAVFGVIYKVLATNQLKDLQLIFSALTGATLIETYFITKIIINFVFSTTDYSSDKKPATPPAPSAPPQA
jgi:hypothetical protein